MYPSTSCDQPYFCNVHPPPRLTGGLRQAMGFNACAGCHSFSLALNKQFQSLTVRRWCATPPAPINSDCQVYKTTAVNDRRVRDISTHMARICTMIEVKGSICLDLWIPYSFGNARHHWNVLSPKSGIAAGILCLELFQKLKYNYRADIQLRTIIVCDTKFPAGIWLSAVRSLWLKFDCVYET